MRLVQLILLACFCIGCGSPVPPQVIAEREAEREAYGQRLKYHRQDSFGGISVWVIEDETGAEFLCVRLYSESVALSPLPARPKPQVASK